MKALFHFSLLSLTTVFLLAGCGNSAKPNGLDKVKPSAPSVMGKKAEETSLNQRKVVTCDLIKNQIRRDQCVEHVNETIANKVAADFRQTFNLEGCALLPQDKANACREFVESTGVSSAITQLELLAFTKATEASIEEIDGQEVRVYDPANCAELKGPAGLKEYCEKQNVNHTEHQNMRTIMRSGTLAECDTLTTPAYKERCQRKFSSK